MFVSTFTDRPVVVHFSPSLGKSDSKSYIDGLISMFLKIHVDDIASFLPQLTKRRNSSTEKNHHPKHVSNLADSVMSMAHCNGLSPMCILVASS
ncbi:hypothetical protein CEXT_88271 [Caerostris extrusa]|uniref:Uncharacterized protein n=1 Tax=Caerostris extrusa TaxID=172846 RepID=A0AAV4Y235_CAEEX|nr:hypothetical protein CEXT_88271 [Caerostris extrusa]